MHPATGHLRPACDLSLPLGHAALYNYDNYFEPTEIYTDYLLIEIWIRPTITYGMVACFVTEVEE